jgi:hypothetical protein
MHGLTQSALLKALGWSLFNSLWQMSLLWATYHLFILIFRNAGARSRYSLISLFLTIGTGWTLLTFINAYCLGTANGSYFAPAFHEVFGNDLSSASRWFINEGLSWCSFGYLLLLCGLLVRYCGHYLRSRRIAKRGLSKIGPAFRVFVAETARNMGIVPSVRVHLSSLVDVPVTLGFLRPVILFPVAMITHLTTHQVEAILVHELAHIRRKDYLVNLLVTVMELVFFFNPFARMLIGQLKKEREHCCDDLVLQFRYDPHSYVSALLSLARQHRHGRLALAATGGGENQLLLQRAKRILQQRRTDNRPAARPVFLLFLTLGLSLIFFARTNPSPAPNTAVEIRPTAAGRPSFETGQRPVFNTRPADFGPNPAARAGAAPVAANHTRITTESHRAADHPPSAGAPGEGEVSWFQTSGTSDTPVADYADLVVIESSDFSIGSASNKDQSPVTPPAIEGFPFVPQSSFSFQSTDTLPPEDRLAMMEMFNEQSIRFQMSRLKEDLENRLNAVSQAQIVFEKASKNKTLTGEIRSASGRQLDRLKLDQLQLRHQYLLRLDSLQRQLQQVVRHLRTVYI